MSGFHLLTPSWISGGTVTSTSQASPAVAASNLTAVQPSRFWRSAGVGATIRLTLDAGSAKEWDTLYLGYNNAVASDTIKLTANASTGTLFTSPSYSSSTVSMVLPGDLTAFTRNHTWFYTGSTRTFRYLGIEINNTSNPQGYTQAGVVVVGVKFEPDMGPEIGWKSGREDPSEPIELLNGEEVVRPKRGHDTAAWTFPYQHESDATRWREINRQYGQKIPMVAKWDPPTAGYQQHFIYYGRARWRSGEPIALVNHKGLYSVDFGIREL